MVTAIGLGLQAERTIGTAPAAQPPIQAGADALPPLEEIPLPPVPEIQLPPLPRIEPVRPLTYEQYREGAFEAAQWAFRTDAAVALDRLAARFAAGGDEIGRLEVDLQTMVQSLRSTERALADSFQREGSQGEAQRRELRARLDGLETEIRGKLEDMQRRFPRYSDLVRPRAYHFEEIRALLRPDEAVLLIASADDATYLFAISSERYQWYRTADLPRASIEASVSRLRAGLTGDGGAGGGNSPVFDRREAYRLYRGLVAPANEIIGGKRVLMTITSGALATLPMNALVTEAPDGADGDGEALSRTHWLADRHVLTTLPAVSSLVALRCLLVPSAQRAPGCPRDLGADAAVAAPAGSLILAAAGAPVLQGSTVARRGSPGRIDEVWREGRQFADPEYLRRRYSPLPGAEAELAALDRQYGNRGLVLRGQAATERAIKSTAAFRSARFIVFATHGIFAARAATYGEPGLVFTPPVAGAEDEVDDGFLSASEVAQLRFNADFVVLSACNTASSDGQSGGEGLSGLARAFFFAGARTLLVSHWEVDDAATSLLMSSAFAGLDGSAARSRGESVKRAMDRVRHDPRFAHPRYWAAFTLVGEAG